MRTLRLESVLSLDLLRRVSQSSVAVEVVKVAKELTEPVVTPSKPCLPLTLRLVPLGARSLTSRVAALFVRYMCALSRFKSCPGGRFSQTLGGVVEVLVDELRLRQYGVLLLLDRGIARTSLAAFPKSPNAGMGRNFATPVSILLGV